MMAVEMLSEPVSVPDVYVSGMSHIEELGDGNLRFTFYTQHQSIHGGGEEWVIVSRLILPTSAVHGAMKQVMTKLGYACCGAGLMKGRH